MSGGSGNIASSTAFVIAGNSALENANNVQEIGFDFSGTPARNPLGYRASIAEYVRQGGVGGTDVRLGSVDMYAVPTATNPNVVVGEIGFSTTNTSGVSAEVLRILKDGRLQTVYATEGVLRSNAQGYITSSPINADDLSSMTVFFPSRAEAVVKAGDTMTGNLDFNTVGRILGNNERNEFAITAPNPAALQLPAPPRPPSLPALDPQAERGDLHPVRSSMTPPQP